MDANVLLRLITGDDARQSALARDLLDQDFAIAATVLLETDWVLRSRYGLDRAQRAAALQMVIDLPHAVSVPDHADWAIGRMRQGADFADMMHVATSQSAASFATFDRQIAKRAGSGTPIPIETLI